MYMRRVKIFLALVFVVFAVLVVRLWQLQIVRGEHYRTEYDQRMRRIDLLPARRGTILDRSGTYPLAVDMPCFELSLDYRLLSLPRPLMGPFRKERATEIHRALRGLGRQNHLDYPETVKRIGPTWRFVERVAAEHGVDLPSAVRKIRRRVETIREKIKCTPREAYQPHPILKQLDEAAAAVIKSELFETVGLSVRPSHKRSYPYGDLACHLIGLTGPVDADEIEKFNVSERDADLLTRLRGNYQYSDAIGKSGVEKMCEGSLRGKRGYHKYNRIAGAEELRTEVPAAHGRDVRVTIDIKLQQAITQEFRDRGQNGSAVVISIPDGEVLALVSVPTYDLNEYRSIYPVLLKDEVDLPLLHRAVARRYPPGSTAKVITALAGLSGGVLSADRQFRCTGRLFPDYPDRWRCWLSRGHGTLDLLNGIKHSCNVYFYHVGELVGPEQLSAWFSLFGYDLPCGTHLPEERPGLVPSQQWLRVNRNRSFRRGDARLMAIGQGAMEVTPLHVANAMATIARGGEFISPTVVRAATERRVARLGILKSHIDLVTEGMYRAVNERGGTANKAFYPPGVAPLGVVVCGKTGTAETAPHRVDSNGDGRIDRTDRIVRTGNTAWFAGFAPRANPRIAFAVAVEYVPGGGSVYAAPIARQLVLVSQQLGHVGADEGRYAENR